jgi:predicted nuclease with TOPRIM domain
MGGAPVSSYSSSPFYKELSDKYQRRSDRNENLQERLSKVRETRASLLGREPNAAPAAVAGDAKKPAPAASPMPFNELLKETERLQNRNQNMRERVQDIRAQNQAIRSGVESGLAPADALKAYEAQMKAKAERRQERRG